MSRIISVHEYDLKHGASGQLFENAILKARERGLLSLPGLVDCHLVKGIRGFRNGFYASVCAYESREAWERLWGPIDKPLSKAYYPENWKVWEDEVLSPFLDREPDKIRFTSYLEL